MKYVCTACGYIYDPAEGDVESLSDRIVVCENAIACLIYV